MFKNKQKITVSHYFYLNPKRCGPFFLVQAGESFCSADTVIPPHTQYCFELTYALSGSAVCYADGMASKISKGDCFFSFPDEIHRIESDSENPLHFIFLAFHAKEKTREGHYIESIKNSFPSKSQRTISEADISQALMLILKELKKDDEYTPRMIRSHLEEILIECCRKIHNTPTLLYPTRHSDSEMLTRDLISCIDENVGKISCVNDLSEIFHYSPPTLAKLFRTYTGIPIGKYISGKRMELANRLLSEGYSVTAVSEQLKYSSINTFSRAYKDYFHTPPSNKKRLP